MRFDVLTDYFEKLEATTERLEMYRLLGELFSKSNATDTREVAYLCQARLLPPFTGVELGIGERMVASAVAVATGSTQPRVSKLYKKIGDLGLVAETLSIRNKRSVLTVSVVYSAMLAIARTSGEGSFDKKINLLASLIKQASPSGTRYIVRFAVGRLRLGVGSLTIIEAVARLHRDGAAARQIIEQAYDRCSDLGLVLKTLRTHGLKALERFKVRTGNPVRMMMAERLPDANAIISRLGRCSVESKLDGIRLQVHLTPRRVEIFSRNLERNTAMFPDIVKSVRSQIRARSAILEGEAVAVNETTGEFYPFQITVQRKRKHRVEEMARNYPLALITFDLLFANGRDLTGEPYETRRKALSKLIKPTSYLRLVERLVTRKAPELQRFFDEQVERGLEGVIAKRLDSPYQAGARNFNWIKLKRTYRGELRDTIDAVLIGYLRGRGLRARLGIGAVLAAVYDTRTDTFTSIAKVGSGLSEENWIKLRKPLDQSRSRKQPARVDSRLAPDIWVEPKYVVTILADEITHSPIHTAACESSGSGLALRFPRLVGFIREDKSPEDVTTVTEIKEMFRLQRKTGRGIRRRAEPAKKSEKIR
jgi:DNA ligase-1